MTPTRSLIAVAALLLSATSLLAEEALVLPVRGTLDAAQVTRIAEEIDASAARHAKVVLLEVDLQRAPAEAAARLARVLRARDADPEVAVLVSGALPGAALRALLSCPRRFALPGATLGPVPADDELRGALAGEFRARGIEHAAFRPLLWPDPGEPGTLTAEDAASAGMVEAVVESRDEALRRMGVDPGAALERPGPPAAALPGEVRGRRIRGPFAKPFLIPVEGEIDTTLATSVERRIGEAREAGADLIIFEVNSPGGLVSASMDIGDLIFGLDPEIAAAVFIFEDAYSGAALVSLAAREIVMAEGGVIGDCQPIAIGPGGYEVLGEKIQSPLRALFRKYADRNGYPVRLAESMITQEMQVDRVTFQDGTVLYLTEDDLAAAEAEHGAVTTRETVVKADQLLTMHAREAYEYGFCGPLVAGREQAFENYGLAEGAVTVLGESWAERTSRFLLSIKALLFFLGITALYMEVKAPGFGIAGAIAIVAFSLFFGASAVAGISSGLEVVLFVLGVVLLALEIFVIPGFGIPGIAGFALMIIGLYMASVKYAFPTDARPFETKGLVLFAAQFLGAILASVVAASLVAKLLPHTFLGRRLILAPEGPAGARGLTGVASVSGRSAARLVGRTGVALTKLRPAGRIEVDGDPFDAVTEGDWIDAGEAVVVSEARANRIVVRKP